MNSKQVARTSATTAANYRLSLPGMKNDIVYGKMDGRNGQIMKRRGGAKGSKIAYAVDRIVHDFFFTKSKELSSSTAAAVDAKQKVKADRLTAKQKQEIRNKEYSETRKKQKEEKDLKAARKTELQDKMAASMDKLAEGQMETSRSAARITKVTEDVADMQKELIAAQIEKARRL